MLKRLKKYAVSTPVQCSVFTLDNAKFWYLNFIYNFVEKCLDTTKFHCTNLDTDCFIAAISGDPNDGYKQGFKHIIKDHTFYNEHVFEWLPYDFYCSDEVYRPKLTTSVEKMAHEKKLLGCAIERQGLNLVALGPKCYSVWGENTDYIGDDDNVSNDEAESFRWLRSDFQNIGNKTIATKVKGVNMKIKTNKERINYNTYVNVIENQDLVHGTNYMLQYKKIIDGKEVQWKTCRVTMNKIALSGVHIKMKVHNDQCQTCTPLYMKDNIEEDYEIYSECDLSIKSLNREYNSFIHKINHTNNQNEIQELSNKIASKYKYSCDATDFDFNYSFENKTYFVKDPYSNYHGSEIYSQNIPECLQHPTKEFNKFSKSTFVNVNNNEHLKVTGCVLDVSQSTVIVVDFDLDKSLTKEQKLTLRQNIIDHYQLKNGLVSTTSNGLHVYFKADQIPYWYKYTSRRIVNTFEKELNGMKFSIDIMIPGGNKFNPITFPGTKAKNHDNEISSYNKINNWNFNDLEYYSEFDKRFRIIEGKYIINEIPFKRIYNSNIKFTRKLINNEIDKNKLDELLAKFKNQKIHRFKKISSFSIMCCIASFDDETYKYCLDYFKNNDCCTSNALDKFETYDLNIFREQHPCYNPLKCLETLSKKC